MGYIITCEFCALLWGRKGKKALSIKPGVGSRVFKLEGQVEGVVVVALTKLLPNSQIPHREYSLLFTLA